MNTLERPKRVRKIAIIGQGAIGEELWKRFTIDNAAQAAADEIVIWNRSNKYDNQDFIGKKLRVDQSRIIANDPAFDDHDVNSQIPSVNFHFENNIHNALRGADIVIVTAGVRRGPGMDRTDVIKQNQQMIDQFAEAAGHENRNATYIIATNPVDTLTQRFQEKSGIPSNRIVGLSGVLDRARLMESIAIQTGTDHKDITDVQVIGQHGPKMVPVLSEVKVRKDNRNVKLTELFRDHPEKLQEIKQAAIDGGKRLIDFSAEGASDDMAPAQALYQMAKTIGKARCNGHSTKPFNCSAFNADDRVYIGRPVTFNSDGSYQTAPLPPLSDEEKEGWHASIKQCLQDLSLMPGRPAGVRQVG